MSNRTFKQSGIGHVVALFLVVLVAVIGLAGWKVATMDKAASGTANVSSSQEVPDKLETKADLVTTNKALDGAANDLDGGLNDSALNADLNDML